MRRLNEQPIDPEVAASLEAIDATLAGEPVDPMYADLAEVALLLAAERPQMDAARARVLDERVKSRLDARPAGGWRQRLTFTPLSAIASMSVAGAVAVAVVVAAVSGQFGSPRGPGGARTASAVTTSAASPARSAHGAAGGAAQTLAAPAPAAPSRGSLGSATSQAGPANTAPASGAASSAGSAAPFPGLQPPSTGRKIVQSAELNLSTPPNRIEQVSQEVYNVIGAVGGIVSQSTVTQTGGADGYAYFELSVPSATLAQTLSKLSQLPYAHVESRTDNASDITDQFTAATRKLADDRALRTALLKQLAGATTTEQVTSLTAQIHDAEASISSDEATLRRLNRQVDNSQISLTINAKPVPVPAPSSHGGGFTVGKAAHDAGRVLTVAAGVALIALAALVPLGLVVALLWWLGAAVRRRRREHALDVA